MCQRTAGMLKLAAIGLLLWMVISEGCKELSAINHPKNRRKRCKLHQDTNRAVHMLGTVAQDVTALFAKG